MSLLERILSFLRSRWFTLFIITYLLAITSILLVPSLDSLFISPQNISAFNWFRDLSAIAITTFYPGYIVLMLVDRKRQVSGIMNALFSFLIGFSLTSTLAFATISHGLTTQQSGNVIIGFNLLLLVIFLVNAIKNRLYPTPTEKDSTRRNPSMDLREYYFPIIFSFILFIVYISVSNFQIFGDQRTHHGIALLLNSGLPQLNGVFMPQVSWFFETYLNVFFNLSGLPSINAYTSLFILNFLPIIALFLLVKTLCKNKLAATLSIFFAFFTSGFGWIYALTSSNSFSSFFRFVI